MIFVRNRDGKSAVPKLAPILDLGRGTEWLQRAQGNRVIFYTNIRTDRTFVIISLILKKILYGKAQIPPLLL